MTRFDPTKDSQRHNLVYAVRTDRTERQNTLFPNPQIPTWRFSGNQAAQCCAQSCPARLLSPGVCPFGGVCNSCPLQAQTKLKINQSGDRHEQEADRVAEQIIRMPESIFQQKPGCSPASNPAYVDEDRKGLIKTKSLEASHPALIQSLSWSKANPQTRVIPDQSFQATPCLTSRMNSLKGRGHPLLKSTQTFFERRFGLHFDKAGKGPNDRAVESTQAEITQTFSPLCFGDVRVHTESSAARAAVALNAKAFTFGKDIVFAPGQYNPGSIEGRKLIGHELVHVVQQEGGTPFLSSQKWRIQRQIRIETPTEREYDSATDFPPSDNAYLESLTPTTDDAFLITAHQDIVNVLLAQMLSSSRTFSFASEYDFAQDLVVRIRRILWFVEEVESGGFEEHMDATSAIFLRDPQITINYVMRNALEDSDYLIPNTIYIDILADRVRRYMNQWLDRSRTERTVHIMNRFITDYGFPLSSAAALAGNLWEESRLLPNRIEGSRPETPSTAPSFNDDLQEFTAEQVRNRSSRRQTGPRRPGIGLAQWTTVDRREGLFEFRQLGAGILYNMDAQIDYIVYELRNRVWLQNLYRRLMSQPENVAGLRNASDDVAYIYLRPDRIVPQGVDEDNPERRVLLPRTHPDVQGVFRIRFAAAQRAWDIYSNTR